MLIGGLVAVVVVLGVIAAVLMARRTHDDEHSVEHYHRQLHTLEEIRTHPTGDGANGRDSEAGAFPASAFRVSGSSTVRLTESGRSPVPPVPPPPVPNPVRAAVVRRRQPRAGPGDLHDRERGPGHPLHQPPAPPPRRPGRRGRRRPRPRRRAHPHRAALRQLEAPRQGGHRRDVQAPHHPPAGHAPSPCDDDHHHARRPRPPCRRRRRRRPTRRRTPWPRPTTP